MSDHSLTAPAPTAIAPPRAEDKPLGVVAARRHAAPARHLRKSIGLPLGPALMVAVIAAPLPLTEDQHLLVAVLALTMTYWITEALPIPVTSILALALCAVFDVAPATPGDDGPAARVFGEFATPTIFLFIGGFIVAQAMIKYDLSRRAALRVLTLPGVARSTWLLIPAFGAVGAALSSVIVNGAVAAMMLPIALGLDKSLSKLIRETVPGAAERERLRFSTALMLMTAYGITVGGLLTPLGDGSNLIGLGFISDQLHVEVSFREWVLLAAPVVAALFPVLALFVLVTNRPETGRIRGARRFVRRERASLGPLSRGEINTLIVFALAIVLWLLPTAVGLIGGRNARLHVLLAERLDPSVVAVLAAALLFALPLNWRRHEFTLTWADAVRIDWGTVLLIGTGMTLGRLMADTGLAELVGKSLAAGLGSASPFVVYTVAAGIAILISETTSNTASVGIIVPMVPALTAANGGDPLTAALVAVFAATYGFMLPISTSANAIAFSTGRIPIVHMIRTGFAVDISGVLLIVAGTQLMLSLVHIH
jgi:sodium-dependent dicarboxylate transporter 2/3/5